jgi:hypothetical protein
MIFEKTSQRISETTIKRLYGFALTRFNPSLYTLNTLAIYCNYYSWDDFIKEQSSVSVDAKPAAIGLNSLKVNAHKMTGFTLQALKGRSGIPYSMTIKRKFIDDHFDVFLCSKYPATILAAPAGYGKTLALCHWVEERMALTDCNDVILFLSYSALMNAHLCGRDLSDWLFALMGYSTEEDLVTLLKSQQTKGMCFFLIIDGVDENASKGKEFHFLINQLIDIVLMHRFNDCFKLVLTMRSSTWVNNRCSFESERDIWFLGDLINQKQFSNVPLLNIWEISELSTNINPAIQENSAISVAEVLSHPLYFQFYYKEYKNNFTLQNIDEVCTLELISRFITDKVYTGSYFAEKSFLIRAFITEMDIKDGRFKVNKCDVIEVIKKHQNAYAELLSIGFFYELNTGDDILQKTNIEFGNTYFLEFSIARTLIFDNKELFDNRLVQAVNQLLNNNSKPGVVKWYLIHAAKTGQYNSLHLLSKIELTTNDKLNMIRLLSNLLNKSALKTDENDALTKHYDQDCNQDFFEYYFGLELINTHYSKCLEGLLRYKLSNEKKILLYATRAIASVIELDLNGLEKDLNLLNAFSSEDYLEFPINPLTCLKGIYGYLKYGIIDRDCFKEITQFSFNSPTRRSGFRDSPTNDLLYFIGVITVKICQNPKKTLRFINVVNSQYRTFTDIPNGYNFLFKVVMMDEYLTIGKVEDGVKIYNSLQEIFNNNRKYITPFMESVFSVARVIISIYCEQYAYMLTDIRIVNAITDKVDNKLFKIYALSLLLKNKHSGFHSPISKQVSYDYKKIIRTAELNSPFF